jgi:hypothetical protein
VRNVEGLLSVRSRWRETRNGGCQAHKTHLNTTKGPLCRLRVSLPPHMSPLLCLQQL